MNIRRTEDRIRQAGRSGRRSVWMALFSSSIGPNTSVSGLTPLRATLESGYLQVADWLIKQGASVPPLVQAWMGQLLFESRRRTAFSWLLERGMSLYPTTPAPPSFLNSLLGDVRHMDTFQWLMEQGVSVDPPNANAPSLLYEAVRRGLHDSWVPFLLAAGADPNRAVFFEPNNPDIPMAHLALMHAPRTAHALLEALLEAGGNPDSKDRQGRSLWYAWGQLWPHDSKRALFHDRFRLQVLIEKPEDTTPPPRRRL